MICQPISQPVTLQDRRRWRLMRMAAGMHQRVIISSDGSGGTESGGGRKSPARWMIVGIVDEKEPGVPVE